MIKTGTVVNVWLIVLCFFLVWKFNLIVFRYFAGGIIAYTITDLFLAKFKSK
jgi:hypothetical protein